MDVAQAWEQVAAGTCLYHMATTDILGYCVFDTVIDLADEAETAAAETETEAYLNDTGANYTVVYYTAVTSDVTSATWFEGMLPNGICERTSTIQDRDLLQMRPIRGEVNGFKFLV